MRPSASMGPESKRLLDQYVRARRPAASVSDMRALETLFSGLAMPAAVCLLGLVLAVLAWLDDGEYLRLDTWTTWRSPSATRPPRAGSTRLTSASARSRRASTTTAC